MKKNILVNPSFFKAVLLCSVATTPAYAVDVSTWATDNPDQGIVSLNTARGEAEITFSGDVAATGTPKVISLNASAAQTLDGGGNALTGASGYYIAKSGGTVFAVQNFGSVSGFNSSPFAFGTGLTELEIKDATFENNTGKIINIGMSDNSKVATLSNISFKENTISGDEQALLTIGTGTVQIDNLTLDSNTMGVWSLGVDFYAGTTTTVNNSVFQNNETGAFGVFQLSGGFVNINNSQFINNNTVYADGGAITVTSTMGNISGSIFKENKAAGDGGAIWYAQFASSPYISATTFENNQAAGMGGALFMCGTDVSTGSLWIDDSSFSGNTAGSLGGGLVGADLEKLVVTGSTFEGNQAEEGGAIFAETQPTFISNSTFTENKATSMGAGLESVNVEKLVVTNSNFSENEADVIGAGILANGTAEAFVVDSDFTDNTALAGGGIYAYDTNLNIYAKEKNVTFSGNIATDETDAENDGADVFFEFSGDGSEVALNINAADGKKVIFNDSIAASREDAGTTLDMNINKSGLSYEDKDDTTVNIGNSGEIQFNNRVADGGGKIFNINLYGGTLSIGQNATNNASVDNPDGFINNNNFYVKGASTLNTANGVIGEFAPATFDVSAATNYRLDVDLSEVKADKLVGATIGAGGSVTVSSLNIIADSDTPDLKVTYSGTNINGAIKDGYTITTSLSTYDVTAENDGDGSHLVLTKTGEIGGLPAAIATGSDAYSITNDQDEAVESWVSNELSNDLSINGNGHGITTENGLDGINVGSGYTLTMNNVSDMSGFNYAVSNEGTVELSKTTLSDEVVNNGTLNVNNDVSLGEVSGTGTMNINANHELQGAVSGNTVNVNGATLSGVDKLASDTTLNAVGGTIDLNNKRATVKEANFDATSSLLVTVNSLSDHGSLTANTMTVAEGAKLKATLAQGIVGNNESATVQLLSANNTDFNNFSDSFDNNIYHFEKADKNGAYTITRSSSAEDVIRDAGAQEWVADAAKAYVDGPAFKDDTKAKEVADQLAALVQNDAKGFIKEMKALAPTETAAIQGQIVSNASRLFKTVDAHLHGARDFTGLSAGDTWSDVSIWATPYAGKTKIDRRGTISGQKSSSLGLIAGLEKKLRPDLKVGGGLHYDETDISLDRRDIDTKTILAFVYGEYRKNKFFVNGIASQAFSKYDEDKVALGKKYTADYNVYTSSIATAVGYELKYVTPEAGLHYYRINRDGYTDTASQRVKSDSTDYLRATMGLRYATEYQNFHPYIYAGVNYDLISPDNNTVVNLANGASYTVVGKKLPRLEYALNFGVTKEVMENLTLGISYMGAYRKNYQEHTGFVKAKYDF